MSNHVQVARLTEKEQNLLNTLINDCIESPDDGGFIGFYMLDMTLDLTPTVRGF